MLYPISNLILRKILWGASPELIRMISKEIIINKDIGKASVTTQIKEFHRSFTMDTKQNPVDSFGGN